MIKDQILSYFGQSKKAIIIILTYIMLQLEKSIMLHFLPFLALALLVVSMDLFSPHTMVEIKLSAWQGQVSERKNRCCLLPYVIKG